MLPAPASSSEDVGIWFDRLTLIRREAIPLGWIPGPDGFERDVFAVACTWSPLSEDLGPTVVPAMLVAVRREQAAFDVHAVWGEFARWRAGASRGAPAAAPPLYRLTSSRPFRPAAVVPEASWETTREVADLSARQIAAAGPDRARRVLDAVFKSTPWLFALPPFHVAGLADGCRYAAEPVGDLSALDAAWMLFRLADFRSPFGTARGRPPGSTDPWRLYRALHDAVVDGGGGAGGPLDGAWQFVAAAAYASEGVTGVGVRAIKARASNLAKRVHEFRGRKAALDGRPFLVPDFDYRPTAGSTAVAQPPLRGALDPLLVTWLRTQRPIHLLETLLPGRLVESSVAGMITRASALRWRHLPFHRTVYEVGPAE